MTDDQTNKIGQDEWVEQEEERRQQSSGLQALIERATEIMPVWVWLLIGFGLAAAIPLLGPTNQVLRVLTDIALFAILAVGLNVVAGYSGLLDLGYVAFFGVGAYTYAYLSSDFITDAGVHLFTPFTLVIAIALGCLIGVLLGASSLRLSGDYLAIVTLGFGLAFVNLMNGLTRVQIPGIEDSVNLTGGPNGITGLENMFAFSLEAFRSPPTPYYYIMLVSLVLVVLVVYHLNESPLGRAWRSMREDELATKAMGMNTSRLKLQAFMIGAGIAAFAGALQAAYRGAVFPADYDTDTLITVYAIVVLGGLGSLPGVLMGAVIMLAAPELLRNPTLAALLFYGGTVTLLLSLLKPRWKSVVSIGGALLLGGVLSLIGGSLVETTAVEPLDIPDTIGSVGDALSYGVLTVRNALRSLVFVPGEADWIGNWAFVLMFGGVLIVSRLRNELLQLVTLVPTLYLLIVAWELRMSEEINITRIMFIGILLVVLMIYRPSGLLGRNRVEIV